MGSPHAQRGFRHPNLVSSKTRGHHWPKRARALGTRLQTSKNIHYQFSESQEGKCKSISYLIYRSKMLRFTRCNFKVASGPDNLNFDFMK